MEKKKEGRGWIKKRKSQIRLYNGLIGWKKSLEKKKKKKEEELRCLVLQFFIWTMKYYNVFKCFRYNR